MVWVNEPRPQAVGHPIPPCRESECAPDPSITSWPAQDFPSLIVYRDRLWLLGGRDPAAAGHVTDVWASRDGAAWETTHLRVPLARTPQRSLDRIPRQNLVTGRLHDRSGQRPLQRHLDHAARLDSVSNVRRAGACGMMDPGGKKADGTVRKKGPARRRR